jgi:hypothetical protein
MATQGLPRHRQRVAGRGREPGLPGAVAHLLWTHALLDAPDAGQRAADHDQRRQVVELLHRFRCVDRADLVHHDGREDRAEDHRDPDDGDHAAAGPVRGHLGHQRMVTIAHRRHAEAEQDEQDDRQRERRHRPLGDAVHDAGQAQEQQAGQHARRDQIGRAPVPEQRVGVGEATDDHLKRRQEVMQGQQGGHDDRRDAEFDDGDAVEVDGQQREHPADPDLGQSDAQGPQESAKGRPHDPASGVSA